jgi:hypothetical protein
MLEKEFRRGDFLFEEGDRSDVVFKIISGSVEILKTIEDRVQVVGAAKAGQTIGEISTTIDRKRTTSACVTSDGTSVQLLNKEEFLRRTSRDPDAAYDLMNRIGERLHAANRRVSDVPSLHAARSAKRHHTIPEAEKPAPLETPDTKLTIIPHSDLMAKQIPKDGIAIVASPFIVGRKLLSDEMPLQHGFGRLFHSEDRRAYVERRKGGDINPETKSPRVHLQLDDNIPFRLSRIHFSIQKMANGVHIVRDLGSSLGTKVNNAYLGTDFPRDFANLDMGKNLITAGGRQSPFVFQVVIGKM